jgi:hypothetical protein
LPEYPVSFDGRTNLYGNEKIRRSFQTWSSVDGWMHDPDFTPCRIVLAQKPRVLTESLRESATKWTLVYEDDVACVFVRK